MRSEIGLSARQRALQQLVIEDVRTTGAIGDTSVAALNRCVDELPAHALNALLLAIGAAKRTYDGDDQEESPRRAAKPA